MDSENKIVRLYIDEVGNTAYPNSDPGQNFERRYLGLCCVVLKKVDQSKYLEDFTHLRNIITNDADNHGGIHIHRKDILDKRNHFKLLIDKEKETEFNNKILEILSKNNFRVIFRAIDKFNHKKRYVQPLYPYNYMIGSIVEEYVRFLEVNNSYGDVMIESRGKKEDNLLQEFFESFLKTGSSFCSPERIATRITSKNIKFREKSDNIPGLELADILAVPILFQLLEDKKIRVFNKQTFNFQIMLRILGKFTKYGRRLI